MNELYAEAGVKRKTTVSVILIKAGLILGIVLLLILSLVTSSSLFMLIGAIVIVGIIFFFPRLNVEYEYVFCDGQIDFDKIMGGAKRKTILRIDFENVEMMAPKGSHALDPYQQLKERDFTSLNADVKPYVIVVKVKEETVKVLFEPNTKMLEVMKLKSPRKIVNY